MKKSIRATEQSKLETLQDLCIRILKADSRTVSIWRQRTNVEANEKTGKNT